MNDIEDALQRLRKLEQGEIVTVIAQVSRDISGVQLFHLTTRFIVKHLPLRREGNKRDG